MKTAKKGLGHMQVVKRMRQLETDLIAYTGNKRLKHSTWLAVVSLRWNVASTLAALQGGR